MHSGCCLCSKMPTKRRSIARLPPFERFLAKVDKRDDGCWLWNAYKTPEGYGQFWNGGGHSLAHRWSYEHYVAPIPSGLVIDHLCRNPACVNPAHLECVTMGENTARGTAYEVIRALAKQKTHCKRGHPLFGDNLRIDSRGDRSCRACMALKGKEWKTANRERVNRLQQIRRAKSPKIEKHKPAAECPNCISPFGKNRRDQVYCSNYCMKTAWRKRQQPNTQRKESL